MTMFEVNLLFLALNQNENGEPRRFQFVELAKVNSIATKLGACVIENKIEDKEHELNFTSEEKVFLKEKIEGMKWQTGDSKHVISLVEKLKQ